MAKATHCFVGSCINAAERKRREQHHDANQVGLGLNSSYPGVYGAPPVSIVSI